MILYTHSVLLKTKESVMTIVLKHSVVAAVGKICTCRCGVTHCCKISKIVQPRVRYFYHVLIIFTWKCILKFPLFYISCEQGNKQREQNWIKIQIYILSEWCIMRPLPPSLWMLCSHSVYLGSSQILSTCGFSKTQQIFKMVWEQWTRVLFNVNRTEYSTLWHHQMEIKLGIYQFFISRSWKKFPHNFVIKFVLEKF